MLKGCDASKRRCALLLGSTPAQDLLWRARPTIVAICQGVSQAADPPDTPTVHAWHDRLSQFGLFSIRRPRNRRRWEQEVRGALLPQALAWAEQAAEAQRSAAQQPAPELQAWVGAALEVRRCAHLGCTNLRRCCEERPPVRLCSGCRRARFCSPECAAAAWAQHRLVCVPGRKE